MSNLDKSDVVFLLNVLFQTTENVSSSEPTKYRCDELHQKLEGMLQLLDESSKSDKTLFVEKTTDGLGMSWVSANALVALREEPDTSGEYWQFSYSDNDCLDMKLQGKVWFHDVKQLRLKLIAPSLTSYELEIYSEGSLHGWSLLSFKQLHSSWVKLLTPGVMFNINHDIK